MNTRTPFRNQAMLDHGYVYEVQDENLPIIKVIGVGGGGSNAVKHMVKMNIKDVDFAICNTDRQALLSSPVKTQLQLGTGLGAGTDAEVGRAAAEQSRDDLRHLLQEPVKMVFITAGMGGGTGTGAAPVVAELAREMGLLTVAVVTAPSRYEGVDKREQAARGIELLKKHCDTVLVVLNDKLAELHGKLPLRQAFAHADDVLATAVKSIADIITTRGDVNADFMDVKKVLEDSGQSVMGSAEAEGEGRAQRAIEDALNSPLLNDRDIRGAERILLTMSSSTQFEATYDEQTEILDFIMEKIGQEARMFKIGAIFEDSLGPKLRVTVIAAGFDKQKTKPVETPVVETTSAEVVTDELVTDALTEAPTPELIKTEGKTEAAVGEGELTSTFTMPTGSPVINTEVEPGLGAYINLNETNTTPDRSAENARIQHMLSDILHGRYSERDMEIPAYQRHRVLLHDMPLLPEHEFVRTRLND